MTLSGPQVDAFRFPDAAIVVVGGGKYWIPPRDGHPWLWLTLATAGRVPDFNRKDGAHAGRTDKSAAVMVAAALS